MESSPPRRLVLLSSFFVVVLVLVSQCSVANAHMSTRGSTHYNYHPRGMLASPYMASYQRRSRRSMPSTFYSSQQQQQQQDSYSTAVLMARRTKSIPLDKKTTKTTTQVTSAQQQQPPEVTFDDLGPIGKVVAGVTQIAFTTVMEYAQGFFAGIFIGSIVGVPGLLFKPVEQGVQRKLQREIVMRMTRMNTRSLNWAKTWGTYSAAFGGFRITAQVIRGGREDNWNSILSTAAAGAFFARAEGPKGMLKGALLYGGMVYLLSGGSGKGRLESITETDDF